MGPGAAVRLLQARPSALVQAACMRRWARARARAGVALGYSQLTDADIISLPVPQLQTDGLLFVWVINAKYKFTLDLFDRWGYTCGGRAQPVLMLILCLANT